MSGGLLSPGIDLQIKGILSTIVGVIVLFEGLTSIFHGGLLSLLFLISGLIALAYGVYLLKYAAPAWQVENAGAPAVNAPGVHAGNAPPCSACGGRLLFDSAASKYYCGNAGCALYARRL